MVTRMGHAALRVPDLNAAVEFQTTILGLVETERTANVSYLTCNDRHHELILIQDPTHRGYDHIGLEVADAGGLSRIVRSVERAGGSALGKIYDGEPGIDRAVKVRSRDGHVFKLFCGMERGTALPDGDRPTKFEHASLKVRNPWAMERFLKDGLGFRFSDRMGKFASWWHCDADHHGMAVVLAPTVELSHYAFSFDDLSALGRVADRLTASRGQKLIWGPSRHGPGDNLFTYFHDHDGAMIECCAELAKMPPEGDYQAHAWPQRPSTINQWGAPPPLRFILTGYPIAPPVAGRPAWAMAPGRTLEPAE